MDPFRKQYRELSQEEKARVDAIKEKAGELHALLDHEFPRSSAGITMPGLGAREMALARTKLEECVMWATKAVTG